MVLRRVGISILKYNAYVLPSSHVLVEVYAPDGSGAHRGGAGGGLGVIEDVVCVTLSLDARLPGGCRAFRRGLEERDAGEGPEAASDADSFRRVSEERAP